MVDVTEREPTACELPRGVRVMVAGASNVSEVPGADTDRILSFCSSFGRALARADAPIVLITGGRHDEFAVDRAVAQGFIDADRRSDRARSSDRLVTFLEEDPSKAPTGPFAGSVLCRSGITRQARRFAMALAVDVVVGISGAKGTRDALNLGLALVRPTLPLSFTGGTSHTLWKRSGGEEVSELENLVVRQFGTECAARVKNGLPADPSEQRALAEQIASWVVDAAVRPCFVAMAYPGSGTPVMPRVLLDAMERANLRPVVASATPDPGKVHDAMLRQIENAAVVVGLLDDPEHPGGNPNVLYEVGYAHGHGVPTVLVARDPENTPFDVRSDRFVKLDLVGDLHGNGGGDPSLNAAAAEDLSRHLHYAAHGRP